MIELSFAQPDSSTWSFSPILRSATSAFVGRGNRAETGYFLTSLDEKIALVTVWSLNASRALNSHLSSNHTLLGLQIAECLIKFFYNAGNLLAIDP